jgi:spore coat protein U-like protein
MGNSLKITLPKTAFVNRKEQKMKTKLNQSKLKLAIVSAMLVGSAGFSTAGYAVATKTDSMQVTTNVLMSCTVDAPTLDFLTYDPTQGVDTLGTSIITSNCTGGGSATITMNGGSAVVTGSSDAVPLRQMTHSDATKLNYQLYKENARTTVWGNDAGSGKTFTAVSGDNTETVYGSITAGQAASFGSFYDFVVVTLTY